MLFTPAAAPARRGSTLRIASVAIGAKMPPIPSPSSTNGGRKCHQGVSTPATATIHATATANAASAEARM